MQAGFSRHCITPPLGTLMMGFGKRDRDHGCVSIHDDLFVRALYLKHDREEALVLGFDLCFIGREEADRFKGAIGRRLDLSPRQILMNASHSHTGPAVGTWAYADYVGPDRLYLQRLESAVVRAACEACDAAREVRMWAGVARSALPINRRRCDEYGNVSLRPNPEGPVYDSLPVCLFRTPQGEPVCLLFSLACHPATNSGFIISAEFPGVAMDRIGAHLGSSVSMFLQGVGGDAMPSVISEGDHFRIGQDWGGVAESGAMLAQEVIAEMDSGLDAVEPDLQAAIVEMEWPLMPARERAGYEALMGDRIEDVSLDLVRLWAARQVERLDRGEKLASGVPVTLQGIQLARGLRLVGLEGEPVAAYGHQIDDFYGDGITFPLGYANGQGLYLVTSDQLDEGGMEVESFYEYTWPAPLAKGMELILATALKELHSLGIE